MHQDATPWSVDTGHSRVRTLQKSSIIIIIVIIIYLNWAELARI